MGGRWGAQAKRQSELRHHSSCRPPTGMVTARLFQSGPSQAVRMRTTLELPDPLFPRLKARAASERVTLKQLLRSYVEQGLSAPPERAGPSRSTTAEKCFTTCCVALNCRPGSGAMPIWRPWQSPMAGDW